MEGSQDYARASSPIGVPVSALNMCGARASLGISFLAASGAHAWLTGFRQIFEHLTPLEYMFGFAHACDSLLIRVCRTDVRSRRRRPLERPQCYRIDDRDLAVDGGASRWCTAFDVADSGAVLVRPDGFVAWRSRDEEKDPDSRLAPFSGNSTSDNRDMNVRQPESRRWNLSRRGRNLLLTLHIIVSVGLLGDSAGFLAVAIRAAVVNDASTRLEMVRVLAMFAGVFGIPLSFLALFSGVALGMGTQWGVFRYPWVATKLGLIVSVILVGAFVIGPSLVATIQRG